MRHAEKRGKGEALRTLSKEILELRPEIVVTLDGDGQHDPDAIPTLLKPIEAGESDVVVGSRYVDGGKTNAPLYRKFGLRVINSLFRRLAGGLIKDTQSGFRAYSQKAFEFLIRCDARGYGIEGEQLVLANRNGLRVMEVPISIRYNSLSTDSKKSPFLHGTELLSTLFRLATEERPLRYLGLPGVGLTCIGIGLGMYFLWLSNLTQHFSIPVALLTAGTLLLGLLSFIAGITLHVLNRVDRRLTRFHEYFERANSK